MISKLVNKYKTYIIYSILFIIASLGCFYIYYSSGKSFIYDGDGLSQHYKAYIYYGRYLREILNNIFVEHKFLIPQWDFSIGEGADILATFNYYCIGDPITLLCVFFKSENIYIFYNISVLLRLYIAGLIFIILCEYKGKRNIFAILGGSITYDFCFWGLFNAVRHIYFLNSLIYFPLVILAIEKIINNEKPYLLTLAVFISCISNFYFFYNIVILTVIYCAVRLVLIYKTNISEIFKKICTIAVYSIFGVLIGSFIFLPIIYVFLQDSRISIEFAKHLVYPLSYYLKLPSIFISTSREYWLCMGYASPVILAIITLLFNKKKYSTLLVFNLIVLVMIVFPIAGQTLNGMSYISNKWCFAISLVVSYDLVATWDDMKNNSIYLLGCSVILIVVGLILQFNKNMLIPLFICLAFSIFIFIKNRNIQFIMVGLIVVCVMFNADNQYSSRGTNYSLNATTYEDNKKVLESSEAYYMKDYNSDQFYRYAGSNITQNASILFDTNSIDYYWSLGNPNISKYRNSLGINEYLLQKYTGYDQRSTLYSLANVKYYITDKDSNEFIPNNFEYQATIDNYDIYVNNSFIPFGYTYEKSISSSKWDKLSMVEKESALSKYILLNNSNNNVGVNDVKNVDYSIVNQEGLTINNNSISVSSKNAYITIKYNIPDISDIYISFYGLKYEDIKSWIKGKNTSTKITIENGDISKSLSLYSNDDRYYNGRTDFCIYIGNSNSNQKGEITLYFSEIGEYSYSDIVVEAKNTDNNFNEFKALNNNTLENVVFSQDCVSGHISLQSDKYLLLSIPYSKGWKAYVNGEEQELLNANVAYMALNLKAGNYDIELRYQTPLLREGIVISGISSLLFAIDIILIERRHKNERH